MNFTYASSIRSAFPALVSCCLFIDAVEQQIDVSQAVADLNQQTIDKLNGGTESDLAEIQAWRRAFVNMGLKPTQYRCAAESLLRRWRKEGSLPAIFPLIDLCNALSLAFAIPIAVFDRQKISGDLQVRPATGHEIYHTFSGTIEHPAPGEVIFADATGRAHARRWTHRQSGYSAVSANTTQALIVMEAMHSTAAQDIAALSAALMQQIHRIWPSSTSAPLA
ncbi:tRNA synthetase subunit beta [Chania multitudinisentens RB-25]|uniref:tRNA synthetase subunit beta n=1 Tax=Chania multitudinisentens RB-25 TaxID=1441930 RepID=A0A0D4ZYE3_9GAMM|nr:phenylalanine--tRNA ligase beta subunit-related protein [Chania multitudinisentens]AJW28886.1 tRNA synthetase subunit beta [Chania multitudinisentens RB-25]